MSEPLDPDPGILIALDQDPEVAADKFRRLFQALSRWLEWHGCSDPDGAAAESVFRAARQVDRIAGMTAGDLRAFLFGIAANVAKEWARRVARERQLEPEEWAGWASAVREEKRALDRLTVEEARRTVDPEEWILFERYALAGDHEELCRDLGVTPGHLRVMIHRIRARIRKALG